jgi:hypothetical protein
MRNVLSKAAIWRRLSQSYTPILFFVSLIGASSGAGASEPVQAVISFSENYCSNIFSIRSNDMPMPPGFGLNSHDALVAINSPSTANITAALSESANFLLKANSNQLIAISFAAIPSGAPGSDVILSGHEQPRDFPQEFFDLNLSQFNSELPQIKSTFNRLALIIGEQQLGTEALLMLATGARDFNIHQAKLAAEYNTFPGLKRLLTVYLRDLGQLGHLPKPHEFFGCTNRMSLVISDLIHNRAIETLHRKQSEFNGNYTASLANALSMIAEDQFDKKIAAAINLTEPILKPEVVNLFSLIKSPSGAKLKNSQKWELDAVNILGLLIQDVMREGRARYANTVKNGTDDPMLTIKILHKLVLELAGDEHSKYFNMLWSAFQFTLSNSVGFLSEPNAIRFKTIEGLSEIGSGIRSKIKEERKAQEQEAKRISLALKTTTSSATTPIVDSNSSTTNKTDVGRRKIKDIGGAAAGLMSRQERRESSRQTELRTEEANEAQDMTRFPLPDSHSIDLATLMTQGTPIPGQSYFIRNGHQQIEYVIFKTQLLDALSRTKVNVNQWISIFIKNRATTSRLGGLKPLNAGENVWEVKSGSTGYRIMVELNKDDPTHRTWQWVDLVDHKKVDFFVTERGY